jgi:hypothetical protein
MEHLSSTHLQVTSPYHPCLSSSTRCSATHLHLGRWSPSLLLSRPFLYPHIITLCHFTSDLPQCGTHIFHYPHFPDHLPSTTSIHMVISCLTSMLITPSSLLDPRPRLPTRSPRNSPMKKQTTKGKLPRTSDAELTCSSLIPRKQLLK